MLNAQGIINEGLLKLEHTKGKEAQVGYDLSLRSVQKINGLDRIGKILKDKTELATYTSKEPIQLDGVEGWILHPGAYDVMFNEGCKIPNNRVAFIKQRSSLYRNGTIINSPLFDPNFETEFMGTIMYVHEPIFIEKDARIAQIYFHECEQVAEENLYRGQFFMDRQRNNQ